MIYTPFYSKVLIKDYDLSDSWTEELIVTLKFLELNKEENCSFTQMLKSDTVNRHYVFDGHKSTKPYIIHEGTAKQHSVIKDLRDIFIEGYLEMNKAFNNQYSEEYLKNVYIKDSGNFAVLKKGARVGAHNHPSIAFAIFYLTDIDNDQDGGELVLHDPSFNHNKHFAPSKEIRIKTKKNRLVIGPANVWHEVTPYYGDNDRMCAVIDLKR
jgi:hypothetical protein